LRRHRNAFWWKSANGRVSQSRRRKNRQSRAVRMSINFEELAPADIFCRSRRDAHADERRLDFVRVLRVASWQGGINAVATLWSQLALLSSSPNIMQSTNVTPCAIVPSFIAPPLDKSITRFA